jgi:hypothetical protein
MPHDFLHQHKDFPELIRIVGDERSIDPVLVEKDYWIVHCLYGLQQLEYTFELKGGTSLSKGYGIIERFSEDIDIRIEPPVSLEVKTNPNQQKPGHIASRKNFYEWLADSIKIEGIMEVNRDLEFDDSHYYRSAGIRLHYKSYNSNLAGLKEGVLLEVGFDNVSPNLPKTISSWAYDFAADKVDIADNRAIDVACYHPGYTFVEKLQTVSTKYRRHKESGEFPANFMRHYYDIYCLLKEPVVLQFIGTEEYSRHKAQRFRSGDNPVLAENQAFLLSDPETSERFTQAYKQSRSLYYQSQPEFEEILSALSNLTLMEGA